MLQILTSGSAAVSTASPSPILVFLPLSTSHRNIEPSFATLYIVVSSSVSATAVGGSLCPLRSRAGAEEEHSATEGRRRRWARVRLT